MDCAGDHHVPEDDDVLSDTQGTRSLARSPPTPAPAWRIPQPEAIAWRDWDDEVVVYDDVSGSTHRLSALGSEVLLALLRHPLGIDFAALARDVTARVEVPTGTPLAAEIERALLQLAELGLAARNPD